MINSFNHLFIQPLMYHYIGMHKIGPDRKTGPDRTGILRSVPRSGIFGFFGLRSGPDRTVKDRDRYGPVRSGLRSGVFQSYGLRFWTGP